MLEYSRATQQDSKELAQRRLDYLREDLGTLAPEEEQTLTANLPRYFSEHLEKNLFAFVAKDSGRIVATALLVLVEKPCSPSFPRGRIGEVLSVYTMPQYRRKGIAAELMKNRIHLCLRAGLLCKPDFSGIFHILRGHISAVCLQLLVKDFRCRRKGLVFFGYNIQV